MLKSQIVQNFEFIVFLGGYTEILLEYFQFQKRILILNCMHPLPERIRFSAWLL